MKKIILTALTCLALAGCADDKKQEQTLLDSVIKVHDKVMGEDEQLMKNKMKVDTLLKTKLAGDTAAQKAKLMGLSVQLNNAEDAMTKWMQKFDMDQKGKSHAEVMSYFSAQKTQILAIDSVMNAAINVSGDYIKQVQK